MSRNLYKSYWVAVSDEDKVVIDSNVRLKQRIEELEALRRHRESVQLGFDDSEEGEPEFVGGLGGEQIDALLADYEDGEEGGIIKAAPEEQGPDLEEIEAQAQAMLDDAQAQIDEMMENAKREIEEERRRTLEDANRLGYDEGYKAGRAEADEMKREVAAVSSALRSIMVTPRPLRSWIPSTISCGMSGVELIFFL